MSAPEIPELAQEATALMRARLGARGDTLNETLRQRGRRLPRKIRRAAEHLAEAEAMAGHPRLRVLLDNAQIKRAGRQVVNHLRALGAAQRRWQLFLSIAGSMSFAFLVTTGGVIAVLVWRGFL